MERYVIPPEADHGAASLRWQAHVDAGRIGNRLPVPPEVAVNRDASAALFRALAIDRRRPRDPRA